MILERIEICNVRNISNSALELEPEFNFLIGPNGAGKTTVLECIHLVVRGRSFRFGGLNSLISFGQDDLLVRAFGKHMNHQTQIGVQKHRNGRLRMRMNRSDIRQVSRIAATMPIQLFLPNLSNLVFGAPAYRRLWLDWSVFHTRNDYVIDLREFQRALRQRNATLRQKGGDQHSWSVQFVKRAHQLNEARKSMFERLKKSFEQVLFELDPELRIELQYRRGWGDSDLLQALESDRRLELKYGATRLGPHRSDVLVRVLDSGTGKDYGPAVRVLSRGQGKAVACAMKIAQVNCLKQHLVQTVVLLDDVASEFDETYRQRFFQILGQTDSQVVATTAQESDVVKLSQEVKGNDPRIFKLNNGVLTAL